MCRTTCDTDYFWTGRCQVDDFSDLLAALTPQPRTAIEETLLSTAAGVLGKKDDKWAPYRDDPVAYAHDVLGVKYLAQRDEDMLMQLAAPHDDIWHGKMAIQTGVNYGKTHKLGILTNWFFDARGPCIIPTTAPSDSTVKDLLWKEVRVQRGRADPKWGIGPKDFIGPSAPRMERNKEWWAAGYVASKGENFKGRHTHRMMFIFDEAVGLNELYFRATKTMYKPDGNMLWICAYNPTETSSVMYSEVMAIDSEWIVWELSSLEHPNILAGLRGEPPPIPAAVDLGQLMAGIKDDCEEIDGDPDPARDFQFPPGGKWWRPGGAFESEFLGRWPSEDEAALWSDAAWNAITQPLKWSDIVIPVDEIPVLGGDVARKGTNRTALPVMWGNYLVHFESKQGLNTMQTSGRCVELVTEWAERANVGRRAAKLPELSPRQIPMNIDDDGIGGAVVDRLRELGYLVYAINAQTPPSRPHRYPDKRSELWFDTRARARRKMLFLGLMPKRVLDQLKLQAKAPLWCVNSQGQREIESKERMMQRLDGKSPDGMDGLNLACRRSELQVAEMIDVPHLPLHHRFQQQVPEERHRMGPSEQRRPRRSLFGQGR